MVIDNSATSGGGKAPRGRIVAIAARLREQQGTVIPLFAIMLVALFGFVALAIDWGRLHEERRLLQNAVDAAALAGVQELPGDTGGAYNMAENYLGQNRVVAGGVFATTYDIDFASTFVDDDTIVVTARRTIPTLFGRVLGVTETDVSATAKGIVGMLGDSKCVLPLAAKANDPNPLPDGSVLPAGQPFWYYSQPTGGYVIKSDSFNQSSGNFGGMDIYGPSNFWSSISGECPDDASLDIGPDGADYKTQTGDGGNRFVESINTRLAGADLSRPLEDYATKKGDYWYPNGGKNWSEVSTRFVYLPVVDYGDYLACSGSCNPGIKVLSLVLFFITSIGCDDGSDLGSCPPGHAELKGYIVPAAAEGEFAPFGDIFGTRVERLWQ